MRCVGGNDMAHRSSDLIAFFEKPELDLARYRADPDDLLGDTFEYPVRHFVSRVERAKGWPLKRGSTSRSKGTASPNHGLAQFLAIP